MNNDETESYGSLFIVKRKIDSWEEWDDPMGEFFRLTPPKEDFRHICADYPDKKYHSHTYEIESETTSDFNSYKYVGTGFYEKVDNQTSEKHILKYCKKIKTKFVIVTFIQ